MGPPQETAILRLAAQLMCDERACAAQGFFGTVNRACSLEVKRYQEGFGPLRKAAVFV